ncbi:MAG TPA: DUF167 domain-containing protein [Thermoguttaceae bacterium]|nr:DUF167 domain-containing protein [Thermoguttaceae bacterium]HPP53775.1 DUF167 domain-containing protein [Thermoguttaceae bacterium]
MNLWRQHPEGVVVPLRVSAGARRNQLRWEPDGLLRVWLTQSPEKGKANQALLELVAKTLQIRKSQLELLSGHSCPQKRLLIRLNAEELARLVG